MQYITLPEVILIGLPSGIGFIWTTIHILCMLHHGSPDEFPAFQAFLAISFLTGEKNNFRYSKLCSKHLFDCESCRYFHSQHSFECLLNRSLFAVMNREAAKDSFILFTIFMWAYFVVVLLFFTTLMEQLWFVRCLSIFKMHHQFWKRFTTELW